MHVCITYDCSGALRRDQPIVRWRKDALCYLVLHLPGKGFYLYAGFAETKTKKQNKYTVWAGRGKEKEVRA